MKSTPPVCISKESNKITSCGVFFGCMFQENSTDHCNWDQLEPNKKKYKKYMSDKGKTKFGNIIFGCDELRYLVQHLYG